MAAVTSATIAAGALAYGVYAGERGRDEAQEAAGVQKQRLEENKALQEAQGLKIDEQLSPYREAGGLALQKQQEFLGLQGPEAQQAAYDAYTASPAQKFLEKQGLRLGGSSRAIRGTGGGQQMRELAEFSQGLALQDFNNYYNRLGSMANTGYSSAAGGLQLGGQNVSNIAGSNVNAGAAEASGILGAQEARQQTIQNTLTALPGVINSVDAAINPAVPPPPMTPQPQGGLTYNIPTTDIPTGIV